MVTWGTSPEDVVSINGKIPNPENEKNIDKKNSINRSLDYMGLKPDVKVQDIKIDKVFIGSCTNGRIEDLREAAQILKNKKKASHVHGMVVPGSGLVKEQAEQEAEEAAKAEDEIEVEEGESLEEIKAKLKPKKASISLDMLDTANTYDDKVVLMRLLVQEDEGKVALVLKNMMKTS